MKSIAHRRLVFTFFGLVFMVFVLRYCSSIFFHSTGNYTPSSRVDSINSGDWYIHKTRPVGDGPRSIFVGDANNDGFNDIVTANYYIDDISILLWNATSDSWDPQIRKSVEVKPYSVFVGDANNDGYNDITVVNYGSNTVSIILWNATSGDWAPQTTREVGDSPRSVFVGDANNDGYNDIVAANYDLDDVSILLWNATSESWDPQIHRSVGVNPSNVFVGDTNNDSYNDIVTANYNSDTISILLWNVTSEDWNPQTTRSVGRGPSSVFIGDANNDGYNDIVTANFNSVTVSILLWNTTSGDWDPQTTRSTEDSHNPGSVFVGDANNDGYNDIVTANAAHGGISIILWNIQLKNWDSQFRKSVGSNPQNIFIADANNDGLEDIATANFNSDDVSILIWMQDPPEPAPSSFHLILTEQWYYKIDLASTIYGVSFINTQIVFNFMEPNYYYLFILNNSGELEETITFNTNGFNPSWGMDFDGEILWQTTGESIIQTHYTNTSTGESKAIINRLSVDLSFDQNNLWAISRHGLITCEDAGGDELFYFMFPGIDQDGPLLGITKIDEYLLCSTEKTKQFVLVDPEEETVIVRVPAPKNYFPWGLDYNGSHLAAICHDPYVGSTYIYLFKVEFVFETSVTSTTPPITTALPPSTTVPASTTTTIPTTITPTSINSTTIPTTTIMNFTTTKTISTKNITVPAITPSFWIFPLIVGLILILVFKRLRS